MQFLRRYSCSSKALTHTTMLDADYEKWVKEAKKFKTGTPSAPIVISTFGFISGITYGALVGKVIANLGKAFRLPKRPAN